MKIQALVILTLIGMILTPAMEADTPDPEDVKPRIVFASNRGEDPGILGLYILDPETSEITALDTGFEASLIPKWSPDGSKVLFSTYGTWNLYTIDANGENLTQITDFRSNNGDWSPDGEQIVFQSDHQNEPEDTPDIYMMDLGSENLVEILDDPEVADFNPRWSPDGEKIYYISAKTGNYEIFSMNVDGSDPVQITESETPITNFELSPDGERIVFTYPMGGEATDLFIIDVDGDVESVVQLTADADFDSNPSWSPSGEQIVFRSDRSGTPDLWMINVDGTELTQLTADEYYDDLPDWGP